MPITTYPFGGVAAYGVPQIETANVLPITTGNYFFVSSVFGTDTPTNTVGLGTATAPYATVQNAMRMCKANNYDCVVMMPGHTESVLEPAYITPPAGTSLCGIGTGQLRPVLTWKSVNAYINVQNNNCTFQNFVCVAGVTETTCLFRVGGSDCTINAVDYNEDTTNNYTCQSFVDVFANRFSLQNCWHTNTTVCTGTGQGWIDLDSGDSIKIWDNVFMVNRVNSATSGVIVSTNSILTNVSILRNTLASLTSDALTLTISLVASSTGVVAYNNCTNYGKSTNIIGTVGLANCFGTANFATRTVTKSGKLDPAADS